MATTVFIDRRHDWMVVVVEALVFFDSECFIFGADIEGGRWSVLPDQGLGGIARRRRCHSHTHIAWARFFKICRHVCPSVHSFRTPLWQLYPTNINMSKGPLFFPFRARLSKVIIAYWRRSNEKPRYDSSISVTSLLFFVPSFICCSRVEILFCLPTTDAVSLHVSNLVFLGLWYPNKPSRKERIQTASFLFLSFSLSLALEPSFLGIVSFHKLFLRLVGSFIKKLFFFPSPFDAVFSSSCTSPSLTSFYFLPIFPFLLFSFALLVSFVCPPC